MVMISTREGAKSAERKRKIFNRDNRMDRDI
jgi:hypothetical protein